VLPAPLSIPENEALTFTLQFNNGTSAYNLGRVRLSASAEIWVDTPKLTELAELAVIEPAKRSKPQQQRLDQAFLRGDERLREIYSELEAVNGARDHLNSQIPSAMVQEELKKPRPTHVQIRGDFLRIGDAVEPNVPRVLPTLSASSDDASQSPVAPRLALSRWLVRDDNPLTSRVQANRLWMRLFGQGLVDTDSDFGTQGALPTHPELLDWLASEMVQEDWSTKALVRTIVCSATYRQTSQMQRSGADFSSAKNEPDKVDPNNRLLWRQNRIRVEGEIVRDLALAASGLLSTKIGGPSVYPPQPEGVYAFTQRQPTWYTSKGEDRYRRGMYTLFFRSAPYPMLTTFDAPNFNQTCTRRDRSNTPLQALTVANDQALFELAQLLGLLVLQSPPPIGEGDSGRLTHLLRRCVARAPSDAELQALSTFLTSQREHFKADTAKAESLLPAGVGDSVDASEAAAWIATARVVLNLDEFITRE
jgi:hypothetical protein